MEIIEIGITAGRLGRITEQANPVPHKMIQRISHVQRPANRLPAGSVLRIEETGLIQAILIIEIYSKMHPAAGERYTFHYLLTAVPAVDTHAHAEPAVLPGRNPNRAEPVLQGYQACPVAGLQAGEVQHRCRAAGRAFRPLCQRIARPQDAVRCLTGAQPQMARPLSDRP
ncbi:hypothetical protein D3C73_1183940 [compost metagenome]